MPRPRASVPPDAIRIEDEVWQEAFARREPARPRPERRLHAIEGGRSATPPTRSRDPLTRPPRTAAARHAGLEPAFGPAAPTVAPTAAAPKRAPVAAAPEPAQRTASPEPAPPTSLPVSTAGSVPGRRTVTIRGYGAERNLPWPDGSSRRPQPRVYERAGFRPDRVALWAVFLGILLVIVALASPH